MGIVKETFPSYFSTSPILEERCQDAPSTDIGELACEWRNINTIVETMKMSGRGFNEALAALLVFCRKAQEIMSSTASNYDVSRLQLGITVATCSMLIAFMSSFQILQAFKIEGLIFTTISISYAAMMIASSYVEEEQQFWYWALEAWLLSLYIKEYSLTLTNRLSLSNDV
jgi:ethanolaminephosphotransferase